MRNYCMINRLKKECIEEYTKEHENVHQSAFKGLLKEIESAGFHNMQVYVWGEYSVVTCECDDIAEAFKELENKPVNVKWQQLMGTFFADAPKFDEHAPVVKKVFDLREQMDGKLLRD